MGLPSPPVPKPPVRHPTMDWLADGLYKVADGLVYKQYGELRSQFYNILFRIQAQYWAISLPALRDDILEYRKVLERFDLRGGSRLYDDTFRDWVEYRLQAGQIRRPQVLGEKRVLRAKPSILFPTRL